MLTSLQQTREKRRVIPHSLPSAEKVINVDHSDKRTQCRVIPHSLPSTHYYFTKYKLNSGNTTQETNARTESVRRSNY